jgi:hypothetical protein
MVYETYKAGETKNLKEVIYNEAYDLIGVLERARNMIHEGNRLLTHPLSGSVKPYETPFKSVVLSCKEETLDFQSLQIIEESLATARKFLKDARVIQYSERVYDDFRLIDLNLIKSGIESINQFE